ncbi:MAG: MFS transporter [Chitinophagales bacterium]|nr:MFS transporter [Chitinophagales bacterium]
MEATTLNNKKTIHAWTMFDWANSAYALVISTAIFPGYYEQFTPKEISISQLSFTNTSLYSFAVSFSYIIIAMLSPLLSGIADYSGRRKMFLKFFTLMGSIACIGLFWFKSEADIWLGTISFIVATIGFAGSLVFYDSYLPVIVTQDRYNKVSAKGYMLGYIGSVILLIIILAMIQMPELFRLPDGQLAARIGFAMVGIWWIGFAQYTFYYLPKDQNKAFPTSLLKNGYNEIIQVWYKIQSFPNVKRFLISFFFYSAGVQTVIYLATIFAKKELNFETAELIMLVLILQIVAIGGAQLFSYIGNIKGNRFSILVMILIWTFICFAAYFTTDKVFFYVLAGFVGMVMGGIQSLSRATYAIIIPEKNHSTTSYFSFYDVVYKVSIVSGTFIFGLVDNITNNMRYSVLALAILFVVSFYFMFTTQIRDQSESV